MTSTLDCTPGSPAGKQSKWKSTIHNWCIVAIDDIIMGMVEDVFTYFAATCHKQAHCKIKYTFQEWAHTHPEHGIPILYGDQVNIIAQHLFDIKYGESNIQIQDNEDGYAVGHVGHATLQKQEDWSDWQ